MEAEKLHGNLGIHIVILSKQDSLSPLPTIILNNCFISSFILQWHINQALSQKYDKGASLANLTFDIDCSSHKLYKLIRYCHSKPCSGLLALSGISLPCKFLKNMGYKFLRHSYSGI